MFEFQIYAISVRHREAVRNAEAQQLIEEAMAVYEREKGSSLYYRAMAALGRRMAAWGESLQERYDRASQLPLELSPLERAHE
jgi:hypothetical protein